MIFPLAQLNASIFAALNANSALVTAVGGRIFDISLQQSALPFVSFGPCSGVDNGNKTAKGIEADFQIDVWSEYEGRLEIMTIGNLVYQSLHEIVMAPGYLCRCDSFQVVEDGDGAARHLVVMARCLSGFT